MTIIHAIVLGIVEGITEFLPISSTAHLEIASQLLRIAQTNFVKSFEITIQLGAILAVVVLYAKTLLTRRRLWKPIVVAFIPTAAIGFVLYKIIRSYFLGNNWLIVAALFVGGVFILYFEHIYARRESGERKETETDVANGDHLDEIAAMKLSNAVLIGLAQAIAVVPGVSRSAATIIAGRLLGLSRIAIVEFSFLLAIPTMFAATGYDLLKNAGTFNANQFWLLAVGFIVAFIAALFTVRFLLHYIKSHSFTAFGFYRIVAAVLFALFLISH